MARDTTGEWYAAWWSVRPDSTASIVVSRSPDGVAWLPPVSVDTADTSPAGCTRPPPAIAADAGNVHVAYAMTAPEGPGIFASHSMDRGMMFHAPVAVVYGERIGRTAIGARADFVAVAFEDPNSSVPRIGVAFSRTMAHGFDSREIVSPASTPARDPAVAVTLGRIAVSWAVGREGDASARRILRRGDLR